MFYYITIIISGLIACGLLLLLFAVLILKLNIIPTCLVNRGGWIISRNKLFHQYFVNHNYLTQITKSFNSNILLDYDDRLWNVKIINLFVCKLIAFDLQKKWLHMCAMNMAILNNIGTIIDTNCYKILPIGVNFESYIPNSRKTDWKTLLASINAKTTEIDCTAKTMSTKTTSTNFTTINPTTESHNTTNTHDSWSIMEFLWPDGQLITVHIKKYHNQIVIMLESDTQQLKQNMQQHQNLQLLGTLASTIAHDFNNFLSGISNICFLKEEGGYEQVQQIVDQAQLLSKQILDLANDSVSKQQCNVEEVIESSLLLLKSACMHKATITTDIIKQNYMCDLSPAQILQIAINFVVNAQQAEAKNIKIVLRQESACSYMLKSGFVKGDFVILECIDDGKGIAHQDYNKILDIFFTTKQSGSGIGLYSINRMLVLQGGGIDFISTNETTVFKAYIPLAKQHADKKLTMKTILLAEDDDMVRKLTVRALEKSGYNVIACENGQVAYSFWQQMSNTIDFVITDALMPLMGGIQLSRQIRYQSKKVAIILMSGVGGKELAQHVPSDVYILNKPFQMTMLLEMLDGISANISNMTDN